MQFLWKYVDELVGKGLEWYVMAELLFYASLQVVTMALPLAVLLASIMTFGTLGENYELTALKSAGISLPKIMSPLIVLIVIISLAAFQFSNNVLPVARLKLSSLLYGVRLTKPELDIKERVFYDGITDFSIKIDKKDKEKNLLKRVMIYDHRDRIAKNSNVTIADSGRLQVTDDKKYMQLTLYNGVRYDERSGMTDSRRGTRKQGKEELRFRTDVFGSQTTLIQLQGFDFNRTDEGILRNRDAMKNFSQLEHDKDSIAAVRDSISSKLYQRVKNNYFQKARMTYRNKGHDLNLIDSVKPHNFDSLYDARTLEQKRIVYETALRQAREVKQNVEDQERFITREDTSATRHEMEQHRKFTLSFACLIFFFIGAPLGAIIRKGGLGMPVVISILFFIFYYIVNTFGEKMAREGVWVTYQGMWLSSMILLPIGIFLTYKSTNDSSLLNTDAYSIFIEKYIKKLKKKKGEVTES